MIDVLDVVYLWNDLSMFIEDVVKVGYLFIRLLLSVYRHTDIYD